MRVKKAKCFDLTESTSVPIPRLRSLSHSQSRSLSRDRTRQRSLSQEGNHSCPNPSIGLVAHLGQMKGNRRSVCKRSGVQEITSLDRTANRKFKFGLRQHKFGAFLRCFSCSHVFVLEQ